MMLLRLYAILTTLAYPFLWLWLRRRAARGKEDPARLRERLGRVSLSRPNGTLIWIHAASVGEANSVMPLLQELHDGDASIHIVLTTGTVSSATQIGRRLPERTYHHYIPLDVPFIVRRFLRRLKPDAAVWVESELWPNLLRHAHRRGIPLYLVNARLSARSARRWQLVRHSFLRLMSWFDVIYAGSRQDKQRLHHLGVGAVEFAGNLKYDAPPLWSDPKQTGEIVQNIGDRRVWLASSTHPGEEKIVTEVHREVREVFPDLLTILVPRHPHRRAEIAALLKREKLTVALRSEKQIILPETDLYLADTMGELGIFYRLSGVVFIGGSLVPHGGHNPIEAAQLDCAILCGPHMQNFSHAVRELRDERALIEVQDATQLAQQVIELLRDHERQEHMARAAHAAADRGRGAAPLIAQRLLQDLGFVAHPPRPEEPAA